MSDGTVSERVVDDSGKEMEIRPATSSSSDGNRAGTNTLFVTGFSSDTNANDLKVFFKKFGKVGQVKVMTSGKEANERKRFAHIAVPSGDGLCKLMEAVSGKRLNGNILTVTKIPIDVSVSDNFVLSKMVSHEKKNEDNSVVSAMSVPENEKEPLVNQQVKEVCQDVGDPPDSTNLLEYGTKNDESNKNNSSLRKVLQTKCSESTVDIMYDSHEDAKSSLSSVSSQQSIDVEKMSTVCVKEIGNHDQEQERERNADYGKQEPTSSSTKQDFVDRGSRTVSQDRKRSRRYSPPIHRSSRSIIRIRRVPLDNVGVGERYWSGREQFRQRSQSPRRVWSTRSSRSTHHRSRSPRRSRSLRKSPSPRKPRSLRKSRSPPRSQSLRKSPSPRRSYDEDRKKSLTYDSFKETKKEELRNREKRNNKIYYCKESESGRRDGNKFQHQTRKRDSSMEIELRCLDREKVRLQNKLLLDLERIQRAELELLHLNIERCSMREREKLEHEKKQLRKAKLNMQEEQRRVYHPSRVPVSSPCRHARGRNRSHFIWGNTIAERVEEEKRQRRQVNSEVDADADRVWNKSGLPKYPDSINSPDLKTFTYVRTRSRSINHHRLERETVEEKQRDNLKLHEDNRKRRETISSLAVYNSTPGVFGLGAPSHLCPSSVPHSPASRFQVVPSAPTHAISTSVSSYALKNAGKSSVWNKPNSPDNAEQWIRGGSDGKMYYNPAASMISLPPQSYGGFSTVGPRAFRSSCSSSMWTW